MRRFSCFERMDTIMDAVDNWVFTDPQLADLVDSFVEAHCLEFQADEGGIEVNNNGESGFFVFSPDDPDGAAGEDQRRRGHRRKEIQNQFNSLFEEELEKFILSKKLTLEQFQQIFHISQEEELRYGRNFYRWIDITEYPIFLSIMQTAFEKRTHHAGSCLATPMEHLRGRIATRSAEARQALRRRKQIRPLLDKWAVDDFGELLKVLEHPECSITGTNTKHERKFLARWKVKLLQDQRERGNKTDRDVMTQFVSQFAEEHSDEAFDRLITFLHSHVDQLPLDENRRRRRAAWQLFVELDRGFTGYVSFEKTVQFLAKHSQGRSETKAWKKVVLQWSSRIKKNLVDELELSEDNFTAFLEDLLQNTSLEEFQRLLQGWVERKQIQEA
eukprot:GGOE01061773.1.p1 GENE.GGOE01061773.1~~GGOE01061773.1.p1  ORF type:complete len:412 (+),score=127.23 GGOE01061773.1:77-1237(+)